MQTPQPPYFYQQAARQFLPHRGAMVLVFGILGFALCFIFGFVAWSMGKTDIDRMNLNQMDSSGRSLTQAGMILGMISGLLGLAVCTVYAFILLVVLTDAH